MTSEVIVMNRDAITLAADSAVTVTRYDPVKKEREQRYFKGANKIFQLSSHHPVGLMIFDSATLDRMPWEVIIKDYRENSLKEKSFNTLKEYADDLFHYIATNPFMFPKERREEILADLIVNTAQVILFLEILRKDAAKDLINKFNLEKNAERKKELKASLIDFISSAFKDIKKTLTKRPTPQIIKGVDLKNIIDIYTPKVTEAVREAVGTYENLIDLDLIIEIAILSLFKDFEKYTQTTGIVIAGYSNESYYPGFVEYTCYGLLLDCLLHSVKNEESIGPNKASHIQPFAQSKMTDTFRMGFSEDIYDSINDGFTEASAELIKSVKKRIKTKSTAKVEDLIDIALDNFHNKWLHAAYKTHAVPLFSVIASLPIEEMANLSETFIMLESLKERVTRPTEQVGGPIDVAVITKGDGFIWIKRKHYFQPELNKRYFQRTGKM